MKVIAFTGMPGSGKSVAIEALKSEGYETLYMGIIVRTEMSEKNIEPSSKNVRNYASELREKYGNDIIARKCLTELRNKIDLAGGKPVIIEDIKGISEVDYFRAELGEDFALIAVHTPPRLRFERSKNREGEWDDKTIQDYEEFLWRDRKEMAWGLSDAVALADYIIVNESTEKALVEKVKDLLLKLES
jgi:dephospho-CoA kinase